MLGRREAQHVDSDLGNNGGGSRFDRRDTLQQYTSSAYVPKGSHGNNWTNYQRRAYTLGMMQVDRREKYR
ncbi:hypothetical protein KDK_33480 [Dictyobacter kobayashii]|uniref:Uncharacterized protein n=1 Tax=Dictyobacter kobayashii TaxID=2014872 RepID=A0A402AK05_9CHLR|nr:hypothetical protein KDK_33480 [Dictyobacter kobayashii]